jgi:hypothetical protein
MNFKKEKSNKDQVIKETKETKDIEGNEGNEISKELYDSIVDVRFIL